MEKIMIEGTKRITGEIYSYLAVISDADFMSLKLIEDAEYQINFVIRRGSHFYGAKAFFKLLPLNNQKNDYKRKKETQDALSYFFDNISGNGFENLISKLAVNPVIKINFSKYLVSYLLN